MIESFHDQRGIHLPHQEKSPDFIMPVEINGLPYIFTGDIARLGHGFEWQLFTPDMVDYKVAPTLSEFFDSTTYESAFVWYGCAAGYLSGIAYTNPNQPSIQLGELRSNTQLLSHHSLHHNAPGIGNFLLSNILAVADSLEIPIRLTAAPNPDGKLDLKQIVAWYQRNGFELLNPNREGNRREMTRPPHPKAMENGKC